MNNVQEVPFRVSARTARLIGRENVATAEGAITELVKNAYDADASLCIVRISPTYAGVPEQISKDEYDRLREWGLNPENHFDLVEDTANLRPCLADEHSPEAELVRHLVTITVIDDGAGMGDDAIRDAWMVIGTANKELESSSKLGRTRTGAKGIGRFALDRLGARCQLHSSIVDEPHGNQTFTWTVDWSKFEQEGTILDEVTATIELGTSGFQDELSSAALIPNFELFAKKAAKVGTATATTSSGRSTSTTPTTAWAVTTRETRK